MICFYSLNAVYKTYKSQSENNTMYGLQHMFSSYNKSTSIIYLTVFHTI